MILWWLSLYHVFIQNIDLTVFSPIEIPLFHEQPLFHFKLSRAYFEGFLLCFVLWMSCLQGPFGSWKFDFFNFSSPLFRVSWPQGPFGSWKFDFFNFSSPLFRVSDPKWDGQPLKIKIIQGTLDLRVPQNTWDQSEFWRSLGYPRKNQGWSCYELLL